MTATDQLERFEDMDRDQVQMKTIGMLLWKDRYRNPEMAVQITAEDMETLNKCADYLKVSPTVKISRPAGRPAQEAQPATAKRSAIPAKPAEPPKPYILVQMIDGKTGDAFVPIESTIEGADLRDEANNLRKARDRARGIADQLLNDISSGAYSDSTIREAAQMLVTLAKA